MSEQILKHETANPSTCIQGGQDKQGFEHDRKVVPERHQSAAAQRMSENVSHPHRERRRTTGTRIEGGLTDISG